MVERFAREVEVLGMMTEPAVVQLWGRGVYLGRPKSPRQNVTALPTKLTGKIGGEIQYHS